MQDELVGIPGPTVKARGRPARRFGPEEAGEVARLLSRIQPGQQITLDVTDIALDDAALGHLANALRWAGVRVELRGLSMHQRRLWKYLADAPGGPTAQQ